MITRTVLSLALFLSLFVSQGFAHDEYRSYGYGQHRGGKRHREEQRMVYRPAVIPRPHWIHVRPVVLPLTLYAVTYWGNPYPYRAYTCFAYSPANGNAYPGTDFGPWHAEAAALSNCEYASGGYECVAKGCI